MIGVGNASSNLAAAVGRPTWILASRHAWPRLGTNRYPWYAETRGFIAERFRRLGDAHGRGGGGAQRLAGLARLNLAPAPGSCLRGDIGEEDASWRLTFLR